MILTPGANFSSALVTPVAETITSNRVVHAQAVQRNQPELKVSFEPKLYALPDIAIEPLSTDFWNQEKELRFDKLARAEAIGQISNEELAELESLTRVRRWKKHPRSADEILWQRRQQRLTHNLVQALQAYVEFHEAPRCT